MTDPVTVPGGTWSPVFALTMSEFDFNLPDPVDVSLNVIKSGLPHAGALTDLDMRSGLYTIELEIDTAGAAWLAAGDDFNGIRQTLLDGLAADPSYSFNAYLAAKVGVAQVTRFSDTKAHIDLVADAAYTLLYVDVETIKFTSPPESVKVATESGGRLTGMNPIATTRQLQSWVDGTFTFVGYKFSSGDDPAKFLSTADLLQEKVDAFGGHEQFCRGHMEDTNGTQFQIAAGAAFITRAQYQTTYGHSWPSFGSSSTADDVIISDQIAVPGTVDPNWALDGRNHAWVPDVYDAFANYNYYPPGSRDRP